MPCSGCFAARGVKTSIQLGAQAEASLGLLADYILLAKPGCSLSLRWETWALQTFLELKYAEVPSMENQSGGGIFLLRADVFADQRFCACRLHSSGSVFFFCLFVWFFNSQLLSRASGLFVIMKNMGTCRSSLQQGGGASLMIAASSPWITRSLQ